MRIEKMRFKEAKVLLKEIIKRLKMNNSLLDEQDAVVEEIVSEKLQELKLCNKLKGVQATCADAISVGLDEAEYQLQPSVVYIQIKDKEIADLNEKLDRQEKTIRSYIGIVDEQQQELRFAQNKVDHFRGAIKRRQERLERRIKEITELKDVVAERDETIEGMELVNEVNRATFELVTYELEAADKVIADLTKM